MPLPAPRGTDEERELEFLPPLTETKDQVNVVWSLSGFQYDELGRYRDPAFPNRGHKFEDSRKEAAAGRLGDGAGGFGERR